MLLSIKYLLYRGDSLTFLLRISALVEEEKENKMIEDVDGFTPESMGEIFHCK